MVIRSPVSEERKHGALAYPSREKGLVGYRQQSQNAPRLPILTGIGAGMCESAAC